VPTRTKFDRQLQNLKELVLRMGAQVENSCALASSALFEGDLDAPAKLEAQDKQIDALYRQIETECITLIALQSPVADDLRLISSFLQLVRDLERIGDYAQDLGELAFQLFPYPALDCMGQVRQMMDHTRSLVSMSLSAVSNMDAESGLDMKQQDDVVDADYELLYQSLAQRQNIQGSIEPYILLVLAIRYLERMADHATNIGQRVAYSVTGQR
jgi:phosphate transport system protein